MSFWPFVTKTLSWNDFIAAKVDSIFHHILDFRKFVNAASNEIHAVKNKSVWESQFSEYECFDVYKFVLKWDVYKST